MVWKKPKKTELLLLNHRSQNKEMNYLTIIIKIYNYNYFFTFPSKKLRII